MNLLLRSRSSFFQAFLRGTWALPEKVYAISIIPGKIDK